MVPIAVEASIRALVLIVLPLLDRIHRIKARARRKEAAADPKPNQPKTERQRECLLCRERRTSKKAESRRTRGRAQLVMLLRMLAQVDRRALGAELVAVILMGAERLHKPQRLPELLHELQIPMETTMMSQVTTATTAASTARKAAMQMKRSDRAQG